MQVVLNRKVELRAEVDVFVAGGGPAGIAAAVTAARQGRKVFLAESFQFLGGAATAALVPAYMPFTNGVDFMSGGIGREIYEMGVADGGFVPNGDTVGIFPESMKRICDKLVMDAGVEVSLNTTLVAVETAEGCEVTHVVLWGKTGLFAVRARTYIDCTGDGDLSVWAGASYDKGDALGRMMPGTLCSTWAGVDWDRVVAPDSRELERAFADHVFTQEDRHMSGMWRTGATTGGANIGHAFGVDGTDERSLTAAMVAARAMQPEFERYYRNYLSGYENARMMATGSMLGIRETRRIRCLYTLDENDFQRRASFADEIGRFSYPVDIHAPSASQADHAAFEKEYGAWRYQDGESYGIPYRSLVPQGLGNVLVAGRCIGADRRMQSSIRVMPCCYITGMAAGMAATLAQEGGLAPASVNTDELRTRLKAAGAWLPEQR